MTATTWQPTITLDPFETTDGRRVWVVLAGGGEVGYVSEGHTHAGSFYTTALSVADGWTRYPTREAAAAAIAASAVQRAAAAPRYPDDALPDMEADR